MPRTSSEALTISIVMIDGKKPLSEGKRIRRYPDFFCISIAKQTEKTVRNSEGVKGTCFCK